MNLLPFLVRSLTDFSQTLVGKTEDAQKIEQDKEMKENKEEAINLLNCFTPNKT